MIDQWRKRRLWGSSRVSMTMLILALVVLTLSPLASQIGAVAAQDADDDGQAQETPEAEQPEQPTEDVPEATEETEEPPATDEPVETQEVEETEEATEEVEETPDDQLIPAADEPRTLAINKFFCPAGYAASNRDPGTMIGDCQEEAISVEFTVSDGGGGYSETQQTTSGDGSGAIFTTVPAGNSINVTETIPDDYGQPIVFCHGEDLEGTIIQPVQDMLVEQGRVYVDNREVALTLCTWFNMSTLEAGAEGNVTVTINKHACPDTYDASAHDMYDMAAKCHEDAGVVNFSVFEYGGGGYDGGVKPTSGGPGPNLVTFTDVPNVKLTIFEEAQPGYIDAVVFCGVEDELGNDVTPTAYTSYEGGYNTVPIEAPGESNIVYCDWYNIPAGGEPSDLTIYKWLCPEAYDYTVPGADPKADCTTPRDGVNFTLDHPVDGETDLQTMTGDSLAGAVRFGGTAPGSYTIIETPPADIGLAFLWDCEIVSPEEEPVIPFQSAPISEGYEYQILIPSGVEITCNWFNVPEGGGNTVTIYKWICPEGTVYDQEYAWYETNCTQYSDDFTFTLTSTAGSSTSTPNTGQYQWTDVPMGPIGIQETIPPEYGSPVVYCGFSTSEGMETPVLTAQQYERYDAPTGYVSHEIPNPSGYNFSCQWFNIPGGPAEITIYKWTCAEGYDLYAYGADPLNDCKDATNGVTFFLDQPDPADTDLQTDTGDSIEGAVYFGGLQPGTYTVTEEVPAETDYVFVLDCTGGVQGKVHPYPLSMGDTLAVDVHANDKLVCHWFNVPGYDPDYGRMTVYKYVCSTPSYVSEVDCEIYEDGATFDLLVWNGSDWVDVDTETTDGAGKVTWIDLEPGQYWLEEHDHQWCAIQSEQLDADEEYLQVDEDQETVVKVYNCQIDSSTTGKQPTKYPNTGVEPSPDGSGPTTRPSVAPCLGLAILALTRIRNLLPVARQRSAMARTSPQRLPNRKGVGLLALPLVALLVVSPAILAQDGDGDSDEADPGTPQSSLCLPGTPESDADAASDQSAEAAEATETPAILLADDAGSHDTGANDESCVRGAVPGGVTIESIAVDAEIEILETVGGVMQAPTGAEDVAWYKETARLGEPGNIVFAGHLNYWGVPEGVFFALGTLQRGDLIEVTGDDGETYQYEVEWVRQEDATQPPSEDVLGPTGEESLTLITCGGEWDPSITEYDERTVARAVRITDSGGAPGA